MWKPWFWRKPEEQRSITYQDFWGSGGDLDSYRTVTAQTALTLAPVFAATRLIADTVASLPLQGYRKVGDERRPLSQVPRLFADPTIFGGSFEWVQRALVSLLLRGNAYGLITSFDAQGYPQQVEWLHPDDVTVEQDRTVARPQWRIEGRPVDAWLGRDSIGDLLHVPWFVLPGQILGLSPIAAFATTIESGIYAQQFGRDFFKNSAIPSAVLETEQPVDEEQAKMIKQRLRSASRSREPIVLGAGTSYKAITVPPEESQFLESIKANATVVASIYGVRPERIGGESGNSMTYANVESQAISDLHDLRPYLTKLEDAFSTLLPRPQYVRFNLDSLLRADTTSRYQAHAIALDKGFKTVDEVRADEDMEPMGEAEQRSGVRELTEMVQKIYLGVDKVLTADEAREILNRAGAGLTGEFEPPALPAAPPNGGQVVQLPRAANE